MSSDLSFVSDPPNRDPLERAQQHLGDGAGQAGLACPWGTHKTEDRGSSIDPLQAPYRQVLYNAIFHLEPCTQPITASVCDVLKGVGYAVVRPVTKKGE